MTESDLDARLAALSDADVEAVAVCEHTALVVRRPLSTLAALAREVLRLRAEVARLTAELHGGAT